MLGFAGTVYDDQNISNRSFTRYRIDPSTLEINSTDANSHESLGVWQPAPNPDGS